MWKSDNQGIKEVTFILIGGSGGDADMCREVQNHLSGDFEEVESDGGAGRGADTWRGAESHGDVEQVVPHPRVVDKNWEGYLGSEGSQPYTRPPSPGIHHQEDKSP